MSCSSDEDFLRERRSPGIMPAHLNGFLLNVGQKHLGSAKDAIRLVV